MSWRAGGALIVDDASIEPAEGSTVGLLGPNGSGKSSLLRLLAGIRNSSAGVVTLDDFPIRELSRRSVARRIAVVEQAAATTVDLRVRDVIRLGRIPHRRHVIGPTSSDDVAVRRAAAYARLEDRLDQSWQTLSGGERQRAQIARALAQEPRELLLDEPTNHLDIQYQLELLALVVQLPITSVIAMHDLNLAAMFCDHLVVLDAGRVVAAGAPADVLTTDLIFDVYGVRAVVTADETHGHPSVRFLPEW